MHTRALFVLLTAIAAPAGAQSNCGEASSQAAMTECAGGAYKQADAELNQVYRTVLGRLKDDSALMQRMVTAQRAWVAYRDAECAFAGSLAEGGSAYPVVQAMCLTQQTRDRTEALRKYLTCQEGDLGCPVPTP